MKYDQCLLAILFVCSLCACSSKQILIEKSNQKETKDIKSSAITKSRKQEVLEAPLPPVNAQSNLDSLHTSESPLPPVIDTNVVGSNTLVEIPVDYTMSLNYYYPYFYKTHLIHLVNDVDLTLLSTTCLTPNCGYCNGLGVCMRCVTGFFLYDTVCDLVCPEGFIADNLRMMCIQATTVVQTEVYSVKAYSVGSCKNMCGNIVEDCSCTINCKANGNCCSDFDTQDCANLFTKSSKVSCERNSGCQYCDDERKIDNGVPSCNQCKENFYLFNGKCYDSCPEGTLLDQTNRTCVEKPSCTVNNCEECAEDSSAKCKRCRRGTFLFDSSCVNECPINYNADRITWSCLEPPVFAWYWVFPSRTSCKTNCGVVVQEDWDCSCSAECFRFGNCCQDIEDFCPSLIYWRKKPSLRTESKTDKSKVVLNPKIKARPISKELPKSKVDQQSLGKINSK